jgi:hypothetical protein
MEHAQILKGARVYLSGPMDFVASRAEEKQSGWRVRVRQFLQSFGAIVYDPWAKPLIVGQNGYGQDYEYSSKRRAEWHFADNDEGRKIRAELCRFFYPTVHINRRMVDICDFLIAYCPTNIYSVGTVNEIIQARSQQKPVLFVSPPVIFPALHELSRHLQDKKDEKGEELLDKLKQEIPLKANPEGVPSPWYLALMHEDYFFDGFGFSCYRERFKWQRNRLDEIEGRKQPARPLLPYLEQLNTVVPKRYDPVSETYVENSDWLILQPGTHELV